MECPHKEGEAGVESWDASRSPQVCSPRQDLPFPFNPAGRLSSLLEAAAPVCSHPLPTWLVPGEGSSPSDTPDAADQVPVCISRGVLQVFTHNTRKPGDRPEIQYLCIFISEKLFRSNFWRTRVLIHIPHIPDVTPSKALPG